MNLDCVVFRAVEEPKIVWQINGVNLREHTGSLIRSQNAFEEGTFDYRKQLNYPIRDDTEFVCLSLENRTIAISVATSTPIDTLPSKGKY